MVGTIGAPPIRIDHTIDQAIIGIIPDRHTQAIWANIIPANGVAPEDFRITARAIPVSIIPVNGAVPEDRRITVRAIPVSINPVTGAVPEDLLLDLATEDTNLPATGAAPEDLLLDLAMGDTNLPATGAGLEDPLLDPAMEDTNLPVTGGDLHQVIVLTVTVEPIAAGHVMADLPIKATMAADHPIEATGIRMVDNIHLIRAIMAIIIKKSCTVRVA